MIILLSPTKQMLDTPVHLESVTELQEEPVFEEQALYINERLKRIPAKKLGEWMGTSEVLTEQTLEKIRNFGEEGNLKNPALFSYSGTVFKELNPWKLDFPSMDFAQKHLRILSGIYGMLRPFDLVNPYRLEVKMPLSLGRYKNLYQFWKKPLREYLEKEISTHSRSGNILNLASLEYSRMVDRKGLSGKIITLQFKEQTPQGIKTRGMYAKMARGRTLKRILAEKIERPEELKSLDLEGYRFRESHSSEEEWIFVREG